MKSVFFFLLRVSTHAFGTFRNGAEKELTQPLVDGNIVEGEVVPTQRSTQNVLEHMPIETQWAGLVEEEAQTNHTTHATTK